MDDNGWWLMVLMVPWAIRNHIPFDSPITGEAKLCRAQATLKVRDEMIKAKNQVRPSVGSQFEWGDGMKWMGILHRLTMVLFDFPIHACFSPNPMVNSIIILFPRESSYFCNLCFCPRREDISEMHLELHSAAREVAMARRHHERQGCVTLRFRYYIIHVYVYVYTYIYIHIYTYTYIIIYICM